MASNFAFPDILASKEEKSTKSYGLKYCKAIWGQYTQQSNLYNTKRERFIINRKYAEGLESTDKYMSMLDTNGDTSYLNLDYSPVNRVATIVDNICGKIMNQFYKIQCNAIDPESKIKEDEARDEMFANMLLKQIAPEFEQKTGLPLIPRDQYIPETDEEAEIHFKLNFKQDASIAMEQAIAFVFMNNDFEDIRYKLIRDLIVLKMAATYRYYDENDDIRVEYVDPVDLITPYSKYDDFRNIPWVAVTKSYTIQEIARQTDEFSEKELEEIAISQAGKNGNPEWQYSWNGSYEGYYNNTGTYATRPYNDFNVKVLEFYYLAIDKEVRHKKPNSKGGFFWNKKSSMYKATPDTKGEVISKETQNRYEGKWIIGTEYLYNYKQSRNVERYYEVDKTGKKSYSPKCTLPFTIIAPGIYDMENKSLVERMIPHEDQLNLINLKKQQLLIKAKPPGVKFDVESMSNVIKSMGDGAMKPLDILKIYEQTGSYPYSSRDAEGNIINSEAIKELANGVSRDFNLLIQAQQHEIQLMNEVIGYNSAVDASSPNVESLVGVQKMAVQATNNALRPTYFALTKMIEKTAVQTALMIQDSIEYNYEGFERAIGSYATKTLEYGRKLALNQIGIKVELMPDEEEKQQIEAQIAIGQQNQELTPSDAIRIRQVLKQDYKLAAQLLVVLEDKNRKNKQQESMMLQQQNGEIQVQSAQAAAQAQMQAEQMKAQLDAQKLQLEYQLKMQLSAQEHQQIMQQLGAKGADLLQVQEKKNEGAENVAEINHSNSLKQTAFDNAINQKQTNLL